MTATQEIRRMLASCITVGDLISELEQYDRELPVILTADYGDHCHTEQALPLLSISESAGCTLKESGYSKSGVAVEDHADEDYDPELDEAQAEERTACIILRAESR